jgi:tryptophan 7-halogenase
VETPEIGSVGVGEATIPPFVDLLRFLGIDLQDFVRHTGATYKLGIRFADWQEPGSAYWHPFGGFGASINRRPFTHAWHRLRAEGAEPRLGDFSICTALGEEGRFRFPDPAAGNADGDIKFALHFDAALVARYLRAYAEALGVRRLERKAVGAAQRSDGFIEALLFADGERLDADLFIDCSGFNGVLIEQTLKAGYEDWSGLLPCDRAVAMPTAIAGPRAPYTQAIARPAGWRWSIPLQQRVGNGYVYCSAFASQEEAAADLMREVEGAGLAEPRHLRFTAGRRRRLWDRNCVALGLASGFLEPLESTSIHLAISGVYALLDHFPDLDFEPAEREAYNALVGGELERIRDFIVLHYVLSGRRDTPFWRAVGEIVLPDSLSERIERYRAAGRLARRPGELFTDLSWFYVLDGMGVRPRAYDPLMDVVQPAQFHDIVHRLKAEVVEAVRAAAPHDRFFAPPSRAA